MAKRTWRVARCLDQLLEQVNALAPHRSKASDGAIGDEAHQSRESDHNPWVGPAGDGLRIVTARDFTHDPAGGFDAHRFAEVLKDRKDPRVKYIISKGRIWSLARDSEGWRPYAGPNLHNKHAHVSCTFNPSLYDRTNPWSLTGLPGAPTIPPKEEDDMWTPEQAEKIEKRYVLAHQRWLAETAAERSLSDAVAAKMLADGKPYADILTELERIWKPVAKVQADALEKLS